MRKIISPIIATIIAFILLFSWFSFVQASTDITSPNFEINVGAFTPGNTDLIGDGSWETVDNFLIVVLDKLILVFWVFAVFIMTIWAGYMIIYHGQDAFLSKWKSIFLSGIIALAVALSAWFIVRLFALLLY